MRTLLECYKILEEYPNGMTKDQFYRVARINKQHAKYLLDFGLVPCINTGKKTRKYHIATHDVITYLCDREDHPEKYKVPTGFYIGKNGCSKRHPDKSAAEIMLMMLYNTGTRLGLIHELRLMQCYLMPDETALRELSEQVIEKLKLLTDAEFAELEFPLD